MTEVPRRTTVPQDDDVSEVVNATSSPHSLTAEVSYAIFVDAPEWLMEMLMSPGSWPAWEDEDV